MTERIDHAAESLRVIAEGESAVTKVREANVESEFRTADDYGKKAMGCWAQAQVHATLALAEQQRIANLIAYLGIAEGKRKGSLLIDKGIQMLDHDIREALGLS